MIRRPPRSQRTDTRFAYTTLCRAQAVHRVEHDAVGRGEDFLVPAVVVLQRLAVAAMAAATDALDQVVGEALAGRGGVVVLFDVVPAPEHVPLAVERQPQVRPDRKSTRLNSSH